MSPEERSVAAASPQQIKMSLSALELVSQPQETRNWRGIGIAILVIFVVCSFIVTAVILLTPGTLSEISNAKLSLDDILSDRIEPLPFNATWISDIELVYMDSVNQIVIHNVRNGSVIVVVPNIVIKRHEIERFAMSADRKYFLFSCNIQYLGTYTYVAEYKIYHIKTQHIYPLHREIPKFQHAEWGPAGNQLIYIINNGIYWLSEMGRKPHTIALSSGPDIYNAVPDWSYSERLLKSNKAMWWSEDGTKLCFLTFDDTSVNLTNYDWYGEYGDSAHGRSAHAVRYPKPGTPIPSVTVWVADLLNLDFPMEQVMPPRDLRHKEHYVTGVSWIDSSRLAVTWMKRSQNHSVVSICDGRFKWECDKHIEEKNFGTGWVEMFESPLITGDKRHYLLRVPITDGSAGDFRHIAMVPIQSPKTRDFLTFGHYEVIQILAHSLDRKTAYFQATVKGKPGQRHIYSVMDVTSESLRRVTCLTCHFYGDCLYNEAVFSRDANYYVFLCNGPAVPRSEVRATFNGRLIIVLNTNSHIQRMEQTKNIPQVRTMKAPLYGGYEAEVKLLLPPGMNEDEGTKYPIVVHVVEYPASQAVSEQFQVDWGSYLASKKHVIYALVDGRGSAYQGDRRAQEIYKNLGTLETEDYIEVVKFLTKKVRYVDPARVAIWGWGYGGYITASVLAEEEGTFGCGVAVAPITNWRYYDAVFTEKYMQTPALDDNYVGYEVTELIRRAEDFRDKKLFIIHGTADRDVHVQHSMMLIKVLVDVGVNIKMQLYPDEGHRLSGVRGHMYTAMEAFLDQCFKVHEEEPVPQQQQKKKMMKGG